MVSWVSLVLSGLTGLALLPLLSIPVYEHQMQCAYSCIARHEFKAVVYAVEESVWPCVDDVVMIVGPLWPQFLCLGLSFSIVGGIQVSARKHHP